MWKLSDSVKTIYCDVDGVIFNTVKAIVDIYNEDFFFYKNWKEVNWWDVDSWDLKECELASKEYIDGLFNQPRFFDKVELMPWTEQVLVELHNKYKIVIVTMGEYANLRLKKEFLSDLIPFDYFIGLNVKEYYDKFSVDMKDGILLDDNSKMLSSTNSIADICFGEEYSWNRDWKGIRTVNWQEVKKLLLP